MNHGRTVSYLLFPLMLLVVLSGCGSSKSTRTTGPSNLNNIGTPPIGGAGCTAPFMGTLRVLTEPATIFVGTQVSLRIEASLCAGIQFHVQGRPDSERFTSSLDITKSYPTAGNIEEVFLVEAFSATSSAPIATGVVRATVVVKPTATPPPPSGLSCTITRVAGRVLSNVDEPLPIVMQVTGAFTSALLNNQPVVSGATVLLPPSPAGSGTYAALGEVVGPSGARVTCSGLFQTPVCQHSVVSAWVNGSPAAVKLVTSTSLKGPINLVEVNGLTTTQLPVPPNNVLSFTNNNVAYSPNLQTSRAKVFSPLGDTAMCSATYKSNFQLTQTISGLNAYIYAFGFLPGNRNDTAVHAFGAASEGTSMWTYRNATYPVDIIDPMASFVPRVGLCGPNEVMVGRPIWVDLPTALNTLMCAPLRPELAIRDVTYRPFGWDYNAYHECPPRQVMVGSIYVPVGLGRLGTLTLVCGEIFQE